MECWNVGIIKGGEAEIVEEGHRLALNEAELSAEDMAWAQELW